MSDQKNDKILEVKNLKVSYHTYAGEVKSVRGVSFDLKEGEAIAIVGESGCGKSVTAKSIMGLIKGPQGEIKQGSEILYHGDNILNYNKKQITRCLIPPENSNGYCFIRFSAFGILTSCSISKASRLWN